MASLDDYDEFGNYIGADLDSDDEEEISQQAYMQEPRAPSAQPLEGFDDEPMTGIDEGALMQVDGAFPPLIRLNNPIEYPQNLYITPSYCTKTSSTILLQSKSTARM